jgi:hypothetical protein
MATWFGSKEPGALSQTVFELIAPIAASDKLFWFEGRAGYAAEAYQYGRIITIMH